MFELIKKDPVLKGISIVVLVILSFGIISYLFNGGIGYSNTMMGSSGYNSGAEGLLGLLVKFFLVVSIVGLIIGLIMFIKEKYGTEISSKIATVTSNSNSNVNCSSCNHVISKEFKFCPNCGGITKLQCTSCGIDLKKEWKCCPGCGNEVVVEKVYEVNPEEV